MISSYSSISFLLGELGEYLCLTFPRVDVPLFSSALENILNSGEDKLEFETSSMKCLFDKEDGHIKLEAYSKIDRTNFKMMVDNDTAKYLLQHLTPEYERSYGIYGEPLGNSFSWNVFNAKSKENLV